MYYNRLSDKFIPLPLYILDIILKYNILGYGLIEGELQI